jgi:hypothetical protein
MTTARLEKIGDKVGLILDEAACAALDARIGDTVQISRTIEADQGQDAHDADYDTRHERGRAFLKRYRKSLDVYVG